MAAHQGQADPDAAAINAEAGGDHPGPLGAFACCLPIACWLVDWLVRYLASVGPQLRARSQAGALRRWLDADPAPQLAFDAVVGGQLGQGFLAHIAALIEADPIGQTQLEGVGVLVDFVGNHRQALA